MTDSVETSAPATEPAALPRQLGVLLFLFALALRVPLLPRHLLVEGDGVHYATLARDILAGDASALANPYWSNLWPAVIAAVAWLTRVDVVAAGRIASLVAGCCLAPATAALSTRTLGRSTGLVAGLLVAGHPWLVHFSTLLFTESLFALLLVMFLLSAIRRTGAVGAATTGVWAGLSLLTRPETHAAIAAVVLGFLVKRRSRARAEAVRQASLLLMVVLSFVLVRALVIHHYYGIWDFGGMKATANLFVGLAESDQEKARVSTELTERDENALTRKAQNESPLSVALASPGRLARHVAFNSGALVACSLRVFPFVPLMGGRPPPWGGDWPPILVLWAVGLTSVALLGLAWSLRDGAGARLLATAGVLYAAGLVPFVVHDRLVVALAPLFLAFLAHGLLRGTRRLFSARGRTLWGLAAGAALLGPVSLAGLLRAPALDYAADPVVQREAGEWLAARYPQDMVLMTAAPSVDFYFHDASHSGREVTLPWADYPRVLEVARREEVSLLAIPEWHLTAVQHPASAALLHPEACHEQLRLLATLGSAGERMFIYELRPLSARP